MATKKILNPDFAVNTDFVKAPDYEVYEIGKRHDSKYREVWKKQHMTLFAELQRLLSDDKYIKQVKQNIGSMCPYITLFRLDSLEEKDYPFNISDNSIFIDFQIDWSTLKVEIFRAGHINISPYDKENEYKYYAMRGMIDIAEEQGIKKFRKQTFKNIGDLAEKMVKYYKAVMLATENYTDGYPYKQGIHNHKMEAIIVTK